MVKIQGVDPILMERIRERNRTTVYESNQPRQVDRKQPKEKHESGQKQGKNKKKLEFAIEKLNQFLEEFAAPIRFVIVLKRDNVMVQVLDVTVDKVLSEVYPEKVYQLLYNIDDPKGFVVDDSV
ncbi:flagellar protein FlaG [Desulfitibacter alkalitolerans]|uniref:flagellar protein FlaG n=1 Tax=Desulfitibacter alkalitolerans TaxID=264641 RepID=UPI000483C618|nr:flagellar protein FlaG [Desulfitibacter alkalitolerans]